MKLTRRQMKEAGITRYFSGLCDKHPELKGERYVGNGVCMGCRREQNRNRWAHKPEELKAKKARSYQRNREVINAKNKVYYESNRDWFAARNVAKKAGLKQATPVWADPEEIKLMYQIAARVSRETGIPHHVDHIVPTKGKNVCGLHTPANLQLLTQKENDSKGNKHR